MCIKPLRSNTNHLGKTITDHVHGPIRQIDHPIEIIPLEILHHEEGKLQDIDLQYDRHRGKLNVTRLR